MFRLRAIPVIFAVLCAASAAHAKVTKGPWVIRVTPTGAVVRLEVSPPAPASLELSGGEGGVTTLESKDAKALHELTLANLSPGKHYTYTMKVGATSKLGSFTTAPAEDSETPFRFLVYGDNRTDDAAHAAVVRAMVPAPGDFLIHTGDFVENGASLAQWQTFFEIEAPLLEARPIVSAIGNHELVDNAGINYVRYFGPGGATKPEHLDHTFRWGNTRFFLLNGLSTWKSGVERQWLDRVLGEADHEPGLVWRIVVVHHGPWSSGPHGGNPRFHEAGLPALFRQHKVDLVFSGHDHTYERGVGDGLPFVVTGGGGAPLYRLRRPIPQSRHSESTHHYVEAEVTSRALQLTAIRPDGSRIEKCALSRDAEGWFCGDTLTVPEDGGAPVLVGEPEKPPPPKPPSRCSCDAVGAGDSSFESTLWVTASLVAYARRRRRY
jgi:predicted phosphodiesterase